MFFTTIKITTRLKITTYILTYKLYFTLFVFLVGLAQWANAVLADSSGGQWGVCADPETSRNQTGNRTGPADC